MPNREGASAAAGQRSGSLLEREREFAVLEEFIDAADRGQSAVALVEGPAGIGKSRLVAEAKERAARQGMLVLSAVATELEQGFGFGVVGQMFEPTVRSDSGGLLSGAAAAARVVLAPGPSERTGDPGSDPSFASLHGLYWLTVRLSEAQPLLLAVDDLHWCDLPSLRFLAYLRVRLENLPVLVLCSLRPAPHGSDAAAVVAALADTATVRLHPRPLSERAATELIERGLGARPDAAFAAGCHGATGGNPLLLTELVKALAAEGVRPDSAHLRMLQDLGPASVPRTVLLRLQRLGPDATVVAQALAVLGGGADLAVVAALAGLDTERAGQATASLATAEILRSDQPLGFVHPVVADAVYRDVLPGRRELLHGRAAELIAAAGAPSELVARHLVYAPACAAPWAVEQLVQAASDGSRKGATDTAVSYLRRALVEPPAPDRRAEVLLALGRTELLGDGLAAAEHLRAAYPLLTDPEQRADAASLLARSLLFIGAGDEAVRVLREEATALPPRLASARDGLVAYELFCAMYFGVGGRDALARLEPYRTRPVEGGLGSCMLAAIAAQGWMFECGPSSAIADLSLASLSGGELIAADSGWAASFSITNLTYADREEAEEWWQHAAAEAHRRGSLLQITSISLWRAHALRRQGELAEAEQHLLTCRGALRDWGYHERTAEIFYDAHMSALLRERGDLVGSRRALGQIPDAGRDDEGARQWFGSELELLVAEGAFEAVLTAAGAYAERFDRIVRNPMDVPWRSLQALALDQLGRHEEALEMIWAELELARAWGAPGTVARTLRTLGAVERRDGIEHLEEAVAVVAGSLARLEHARALTALGAALRRWRQPSTGRAHLREALELATVCGAELLAQHARSELYASGGRPRRTALTGVDSLTASERRVAALAADQLTNREIGEALFVTPKTVAMHLSNTYRKLGVTSRHQLATALTDSSPAPP